MSLFTLSLMKRLMLFLLLPLFFSFAGAIDSFAVNSVIVKISLHQGEKVVKTLSVTAIEQGSFEVGVNELKGIVLSGESFTLSSGEKKDIIISADSATLESGVYVGNIVVKNAKEEIEIPVVLEIESEDVFFDLNLDIPPQYNEISPGGKFIAQVKVFDLTGFKVAGSLGPSPVTLNYELRGVDGSVISVASDNVVVDKQTQITKTFTIPSTLREGDYFFTATARHKTSFGSASYFFSVRSQLIKSGSIFTPEFIALLVVFGFFFLLILALIVYLVRDRNKLFAELYRHNNSEFRSQESFLREQAHVLEKKGLEKKKIEKEVNFRLDKLKQSQEKRVLTMKKLGDKGNVKEMQRKLSLWKKQGYSTTGLEHKMPGLSEREMKEVMKSWKKKYKTEDYKNR